MATGRPLRRHPHYSAAARLLDQPREGEKALLLPDRGVETAIYLAEAAAKYGDGWIESRLLEANAEANPLLYRVALKMATGSGKTVVMAMLIAWQALNKLANPQDARFSDTFLIVTPGITIRDRLRVLLPNDVENDYRVRDLLTPDLLEQLGRAQILITNFHTFKPRELVKAPRLNKAILRQGEETAFTETPDQMARRVRRELGMKKKNIVVLNDEAHHCYRRKVDGDDVRLTGAISARRSSATRRRASGSPVSRR